MKEFDAAVRLSRVTDRDGDWQPFWDALTGIVKADHRAAVGLGLSRLGTDDIDELDAAVQLIGFAAEIHEDVRAEVASAVIALAETDVADDVLAVIAFTIGRAADPRGLPTLVRLASHDDHDVRFGVAWAMTSVLADDPEPEGIAALMTLCRDVDDEVRDWATFALGTLTTADSPVIRSVLWASAHDGHRETRQEGAVGLARRRDSRALGLVATMLANDDNADCIIEAAAYLARPDLLEPLGLFDFPGDSYLETALLECDPVRRKARDDFGWDVMVEIRSRRHDLEVALACRCFEIGVELLGAPSAFGCERDQVTSDPPSLSVRWLRDQSGGDVGRAVDHVLSIWLAPDDISVTTD